MTIEEIQELLGRGHYLKAYREGLRFLDDQPIEPAEAVQVLLLAARAIGVGLNQLKDAADLSVQAAQIAEEENLDGEAQLARITAAEAYRRQGEWSEAADWSEAFLKHDQDTMTDRRYRGICLYNYGLVHRARQDQYKAVAAFEDAAQAFESQGMFAQMAMAHQMLAWTHLLVSDRPDLAEPHIRVAACLAPQATEEDRVHQITLEALYALRVGHFDKAVDLCQEVFVPGRVGVTPLAKAEAAMISAAVALQTGHLADARFFAQKAVQAAQESQEPAMMNRANEVFRKVQATESE